MKMKKCLFVLLIVLSISGCLHHSKPKPPQPTPVPTPALFGIPEKINNELRIDDKRVLAFGAYTLLVDYNRYPDSSVKPFMQSLSDSGCNLIRVWGKTYFKPTDWQPWEVTNGKTDFSKPNQNFYNRMEMIATLADQVGVCIAWVPLDFWSIREALGWPHQSIPDVLCPSRSTDVYPSQGYQPMMTIDGYYDDSGNFYSNGAPRGRRLFKCQYDSNGNCTNNEIGSRKHPAIRELYKRMAQIAARHNDMIYIASEMFTDNEHARHDVNAMIEFTEDMKAVVRSVYPTCIIGTSVDTFQPEVYRHVDIADLHGLTLEHDCNPGYIVTSFSNLRRIAPNVIPCSDSDGCGGENSPRYGIEWMKSCIRAAWSAGGFFETKGIDEPALPNILEAFRQVQNER